MSKFEWGQAFNKSFNLNLLECKYVQNLSPAELIFCFNLNLLECKSFRTPKQPVHLLVLISTYWNVNK